MLTLSAGGVNLESNAVAGGVVWRWFWNGLQFVNNADYGREIQAAFENGSPVHKPSRVQALELDVKLEAAPSGPRLSRGIAA